MPNTDDPMQEYDISILKTNIKRLMDNENITQQELADIIGTPQSRVSKCLDTSTGDCFTLCQVVDISTYFGVSVDDLLGISPKKKESEDITLADVFQKLFELDRMIGLDIVEYQYAYEIPSEPALLCHYDEIQKKLVEWQQVQNISLDNATRDKMIKLWENDILEKGKDCKKSNNFESPHMTIPELDDLPFS